MYNIKCIKMFDSVVAMTFHKPMANGKTKPCLLDAYNISISENIEVVTKFAAGCEEKAFTLVIEAFANFLACDLNLPIPQSKLVNLTDEFLDAVNIDPPLKHMMINSKPFAFGVERLPTSYSTLTNPLFALTQEQLQSALEIFIFDMLIKNPDRKIGNPNCLTNGKTFAIFDHDLSLRPKVFSWDKDPWEDQYMEATEEYRKHIFFSSLKGKSESLDTSDFISAWKNLTDERLGEYIGAIPNEWLITCNDRANQVLDFIKSLRDNIDQALFIIREVLK